VLSGLLLALAGTAKEVIELDYMLSRIGTEPVRMMLVQFALAGTGAKTEDEPGFYNLCSLRTSSWNAFVNGVNRNYGGFEQFVTDKLRFSKEDLVKIRTNLTKDRAAVAN
jgi:hypothetical protein